ncbi:MAG: RecX family transcriptional regulator [Rikenellaceae bacterium]|nr:RecX family transcriptional regulator [Rikenellaceae bacterium]
MSYTPARPKSREEALKVLMDRCARAEICIADARRLLTRWSVEPEDQESILRELLKERFIDESRYAAAFVRDKLNFSRWGSRKISQALYQKRIPADIIRQAMEQATEVSMTDRLKTDLRRKNHAIKDEDTYKRKEKLLRFGVSRGYDYETVSETIEQILQEDRT